MRVALTIWNSGVKSSQRACEFQPPGQGGIEILAAVSVNMQHKFQQSVHKPEVLDLVYQLSGGFSSCYTETGMHSACCAEDR